MTDHDDATRALAEAWHRAWHSSRGKYDPCKNEALDIEPANRLLAALAESGHGIARQEVIEDTRRLVRYFTGGPTGWNDANVLARRIRAALEADR